MPARPDPPIRPDAVSQAVREANALLAQCVELLRDIRDLLDEASEIEHLPEGIAGSYSAYEDVVESLREALARGVEWTDDKAELLHSRHSPLNRGSAASE